MNFDWCYIVPTHVGLGQLFQIIQLMRTIHCLHKILNITCCSCAVEIVRNRKSLIKFHILTHLEIIRFYIQIFFWSALI